MARSISHTRTSDSSAAVVAELSAGVRARPTGALATLSPSQSAFLDLLRFFSALLVVTTHLLTYFFEQAYSPYRQHYYSNLGSLGVSIFFVLSGFLISYSVFHRSERSRGYGLEVYLIDRFTRIYLVLIPALLFFALVNVAVEALHLRDTATTFSVEHFLVTLSMLQGVQGISAHGETFALLEPVWSLNYEFFLYIVFGLVALNSSVLRRTHDTITRYLLLVGTAFLLTRLDHAYLWSYNWSLGVLLSWGFSRRLGWASGNRMLILAGFFLAVAAFILPSAPAGLDSWLTSTFIAILVFCLLVASRNALPPVGLTRAAALLSSYSYTMYLTHYGIMKVVYLLCIKYDLLPPESSDPAPRLLLCASLAVLVNLQSWFFSLVTERKTKQVRESLYRRLVLGRIQSELQRTGV